MKFEDNGTIAKYTNLTVEKPTRSFVQFAYISINFKLYEFIIRMLVTCDR